MKEQIEGRYIVLVSYPGGSGEGGWKVALETDYLETAREFMRNWPKREASHKAHPAYLLERLSVDVVCPQCMGCGQIANTETGEPWCVWQALPVRASFAVIMQVVQPIPCPKCGGKGMGNF